MLESLFYWLGRPIVELYTRIMLRMDVKWHAPLPPGPKIFAPNHPTTTDPFFVTALTTEPMNILIIDHMFQVPIFGKYLKRSGHIPVNQEKGRIAFERAKRQLEKGRTVTIFPEGDLSPSEGGLQVPYSGVARLAMLTGASVIPVGIHLSPERVREIKSQIEGKDHVGRWYLRGPYHITVGKALRFTGDAADRERVSAALEKLMVNIRQLVGQSATRMRLAGVRVR